MSKQANFAPNNHLSTSDQAVQTTVQAGQWMFLAAAAEATRSSEKTLRRYIKRGTIKSRRLGKQSNSPLQVWITPELIHTVSEEAIEVDGVAEIFDMVAEEPSEPDAQSFNPEAETINESTIPNPSASILDEQLGQVIKAITQQFAEKLDEQKEHILVLRQEIQQKDSQLRLLPDLQKQAEDERKAAQERAFEIEALKKQIAGLEVEKAGRLKQPWWKRLVNQP